MLVGCEAGFLNVPKIKGTHLAMKSGMLAAEAIFEDIDNEKEITKFQNKINASWLYKELFLVRNIRPSFKWGFWKAIIYSAIDTYIFRGKAPWTIKHEGHDHDALEEKDKYTPIEYPKPDGVFSFDKLTNVSFSATNHEENQPCHLTLSDESIQINIILEKFDSPETR